uniref:ZP domain-containing protein n=1 Tax=Strongyloides venezuelensis TaxID=75913 RepID=A0A0K0G5M9_STRVS
MFLLFVSVPIHEINFLRKPRSTTGHYYILSQQELAILVRLPRNGCGIESESFDVVRIEYLSTSSSTMCPHSNGMKNGKTYFAPAVTF